MVGKLKQKWHALNNGTPGRRFEEHHLRRQSSPRHRRHIWLMMTLGVLLFVAGVVMLVTPGPGVIFIAAGAALIAEESIVAARTMDWFDVRVRAVIAAANVIWQRSPVILKAILVLFIMALLIGVSMFTMRLVF